MKKMKCLTLMLAFLVIFPFNDAISAFISMDTMASQSTDEPFPTMVNESYITPYGTISFSDGNSTPESDSLWFSHDGAHMSSDYAVFNFDFDVDAISFNAWGLAGGIYTVAYDINNNEVDSLSNLDYMFNAPVSLSGSGIRKLVFADGRYLTMGSGGNIEITNVIITISAPIVPEPISSLLFVVGGATLGIRRFRKK